MHYVKGEIKGNIIEDRVCFDSSCKIATRVEFGVFGVAKNFFMERAWAGEPYEGILGLAYVNHV